MRPDNTVQLSNGDYIYEDREIRRANVRQLGIKLIEELLK
jgi:hypothetical protein